MDLYDSVVARIVERGGTAVVLGGLETGKSSFCRMCAAVALRLGKTVAYVDTDIGKPTIGPPATVGLKFIANDEDLAPDRLARPDALYFVGAASPEGHFLPMVVGAARMAERAREASPHLILVDTSSFIDGTMGQILKLYKMEAVKADRVVAFQRGAELEPILGATRRALSAEVEVLGVADGIVPRAVDERAERRREALRAAFEPPLHRWKVKPSVLVPAIPPDLDLASLDGILVGMDDGKGHCIGLGMLEYKEGSLRMISSVAEGARALRLGSLRVGQDFRATRVDLRDIAISA